MNTTDNKHPAILRWRQQQLSYMSFHFHLYRLQVKLRAYTSNIFILNHASLHDSPSYRRLH